jgi:hypothetical protein
MCRVIGCRSMRRRVNVVDARAPPAPAGRRAPSTGATCRQAGRLRVAGVAPHALWIPSFQARSAAVGRPRVAIVSIDMTLGQRLRRAIELILGASVGLGVRALLISAIGTGPWQIAVVVALASSVAVLLDGRAVINVQAAVSAILVVTLYGPGDMSGIDRLLDGLIGGAIGLVIVAAFARSSMCGLAVVDTGIGARDAASQRPPKEGARLRGC